VPTIANIPVTGPDAPRVRGLRRVLGSLADGLTPLVEAYHPYVEGLQHLPADGRFLLVGNHTSAGAPEVLLIPYVVRRAVGTRVRPLAERAYSRVWGVQADLFAAFGGVIGTRDNARELMRHDETVLVFPGGAREVVKYRHEEYRLRWRRRYGFAHVAAEFGYPIVPVGLVGGDDVYRNVVTRDSWVGRLGDRLGALTGQPELTIPVTRGIGPTMLPRPQRMYLGFGQPISSVPPPSTPAEDWVPVLKDRVEAALTSTLQHLLDVRADDPYRSLNLLARSRAVPGELVRR
jgi:1-acyl-sn-glycerol-3-phosphate acyltransferase